MEEQKIPIKQIAIPTGYQTPDFFMERSFLL